MSGGWEGEAWEGWWGPVVPESGRGLPSPSWLRPKGKQVYLDSQRDKELAPRGRPGPVRGRDVERSLL